MAEKERFEFGSKDTFKSNTSKTATFDMEKQLIITGHPTFSVFYNSIVGQIVVKSWSDAYGIINDYTISTAVQGKDSSVTQYNTKRLRTVEMLCLILFVVSHPSIIAHYFLCSKLPF